MIRLMIVDDQAILVQGLKMILSSETDMEVIHTAENGLEALSKIKVDMPDLILMDIQMPKMDGLETAKIIKQNYKSIKIIFLTTFNDDAYIEEALKMGIDGYVLKATPPQVISEGIRTVINGGAFIEPEVAKKLIVHYNQWSGKPKEKDSRVEGLTEREIDIIKCVSQGMNNKEISDLLFLSEGTVKNHLTKILSKLELRDRTQLAIFGLKNDI